MTQDEILRALATATNSRWLTAAQLAAITDCSQKRAQEFLRQMYIKRDVTRMRTRRGGFMYRLVAEMEGDK